MLLGLLIQVGHGEIGAEGAESGGTTPRDRMLVRDAHDESLLALQQLGLDRRNQPGLAVLRLLQGLAARIPFGRLLQGGKGLAPILGFGCPCNLLAVHPQLALAPGSDADLEAIVAQGGEELLDRGALAHGHFLVRLPIGDLQRHDDFSAVFQSRISHFSPRDVTPNAAR